MKAAQVDKLYKGLAPTELANLAFGAIVRCDEAEVDAILAAVPRKSYTCPHKDYWNRSHDLEMLAFEYGLLYWETKAKLYLAMAAGAVGLLKDGAAVFEVEEAALRAMDVALANVCQAVGVEAATVRQWARCPEAEGHATLSGALADVGLVAQYTRLFSTAANVPKTGAQ